MTSERRRDPETMRHHQRHHAGCACGAAIKDSTQKTRISQRSITRCRGQISIVCFSSQAIGLCGVTSVGKTSPIKTTKHI